MPLSMFRRPICIAVLLAFHAGSAQAQLPEKPPALDPILLSETLAKTAKLPRLRALIVARNGVPVVERVFRGPNLDQPVNIKSASKTVISALVGIAIERGHLKGINERIVPLLHKRAPEKLDPLVSTITIDHLLSMRAGLERTSGRQNYGRWVMSPNWVRFALTRPFAEEPGGVVHYSTGNTHLLSAILTDATGKSTLELAREWLGTPLKFTVPAWTRDPQGIYFGGNEMTLSPRALFRFGEMYRNGGVFEGKRVMSENWVRASWTPRGFHRSGDQYGYGWFIAESHGQAIYYAWGYGGQMLFVVPGLALTIVMTSDSTVRSSEGGHRCGLHTAVKDGFVLAAMTKEQRSAASPGGHVCRDFGFRQ